MRKKQLLLAVIGLALTATAASSQVAPAPGRPVSAPAPAGERVTPTLGQTLMTDRDKLQSGLNELFKDLTTQLTEPLGPDTDRSLSDKIMILQHLEIDLAQYVMRYAVDPELRRLATRHVEGTADRISVVRGWQVNRQIIQQQLSPVAPR